MTKYRNKQNRNLQIESDKIARNIEVATVRSILKNYCNELNSRNPEFEFDNYRNEPYSLNPELEFDKLSR